ncbi:glycosyltransferase family 4 protein [Kordiimonas marina]|uniref:glycosyltransferase family 4 protein n=1 Tax=Kordiimonas marina TaxID=2872312 RepID=UPI001FF3A198|nr:glycosyltransferase family 4 protein [Kordiimonas marina]MCJ9430363.1 glycosyltransferase family 4 protein [Kordiimonas marina]
MKILVFSTLFPNPEEPTLGIFVETRLRHLIKDTGIEAVVIAPVPWFPFRHRLFGRYGRFARVPRMETQNGLTIHHPRFLVIPKVGMRLTPGFLFKAAKRCLAGLMAKGERFDLIDAHYLYPDGVAAARLSEAVGIPFVMTARGSDVTQIGRMPAPRQEILASTKRAGHVVTVSRSLKEELTSMGVAPEKITVLRNGVDTAKFHETGRDEARKTWGFDGRVLLFVGWLIDRKRVDVLLDVAARIPDISVVIAGDGPLKAMLVKRAAALGLEGRIHFLGQVMPADMPRVMSGADVLMLPSEREGWANVLLEAMACGTPVVSRAVGGAPDLVTVPKAGRLVAKAPHEDGEVDAFEAALRDLLDKYPARDKVRAYAEGFGWAETSAGQVCIFEEVIAAYKAAGQAEGKG